MVIRWLCLHSDARAHHLAVKHGVLVVLHKDWLDEGADLEYVACEVGPLLPGVGDDAAGIVSVHSSQFIVHSEADAWCTLDGRKLDGKPTQKGVYVNNGKKIVIKSLVSR